ncbi:uncharacterized protein SOCE836_074000 [Sorangium cellulosum]|uniref:C2H2-type domain-containing protein n=1 Tax=Sorangium cellulosum TaxID=56 RepID=A0A4P2QYD6_SORCE|nr:uncharacterized protein SOCE836_074000 [Sorangium cellulosum]WCQ94515.1 hypothetical protein NQZ70_07282 [Sorangium sp. Soce836]
MIGVDRGDEPEALAEERAWRLACAEPHEGFRRRPRAPGDFKGYDVGDVRELLAKRQRYRCAYCELPLDVEGYPIEHIRPKTHADDVRWAVVGQPPGAAEFFAWFDDWLSGGEHWEKDTERYWWLAWTWENLVLLCPSCNTGYKRNRFPLESGSARLDGASLEQLPGPERPLLLDPSRIDLLDHIRFAPDLAPDGWGPVGLTDLGRWTIALLGLNKRQGLRDKWRCHARDIEEDGEFKAIQAAIRAGTAQLIVTAWDATMRRLLAPDKDFLGLRFSVVDHHVPERSRAELGLFLPRPGGISQGPPRPLWTPRPEITGLPLPLQYRVRALGAKASEAAAVKELIVEICEHTPMTAETLAAVLQREPSTLRQSYLAKLCEGPTARLELDARSGVYRRRS